MEFTAENLERAVVQFYQSTTSTQAEAHEFLTAAKCSTQAWDFVWELLQPQKVTEVQFYGATTLHTKIEKYLTELTADQEIALRNQLLTCIISYSNGPKIVLNRLCVSLTALIFRSQHWNNALSDLIATFTPEQLPTIPVNRVVWILLEILTLVPEQVDCLDLYPRRKKAIQSEIHQKIPQIVRILESILSSQIDHEVLLQIGKCIISWAHVGILLTHSETLVDQLVAVVFNYHKINPGVCEKILEALGSLCIDSTTYKHPQTLLAFLSKILPLREIIAREHMNPQGPDRMIIRNIYNLLISYGESHSDHIVTWIVLGGSSREQCLALITALLHCSGAQGYYPVDENYSRLSFAFWYTLQDQVICLDPPQYDVCMSVTEPIYRELVNILMSKAKLPDDKNPMSKEDAETFRCYRQDISDTMMYCYSILKGTTLSLIKARFEKIKDEILSWQDLEACLFSLCSIAENVCGDEETYIPALFQFIQTLPFDRLNSKVLSTALDTIGRYGEWISFHSSTLDHVLPIILLGLKVPDAAPSATMALKDIIRDCIEDIDPYISLILDSSQEALHSGRLKMTDNFRLMHCTGRLLSTLPLPKLLTSLEIILSPYLVELNSLSTQEPNTERRTIIVSCLKMLGTIMCALDNSKRPGPHPTSLILEKLLPVLKNITSLWYRDSLVMESIFVVMSRTVLYMNDGNSEMVRSVIELIVTSFRECHEPTALELSCKVFISYGNDPDVLPVMQGFMRELCTTTLSYVSSTPNISDHTELLREFFIMAAQVARKCPNVLAYGSDTDCLPIIHCATMTLGIPELATVKSATMFLVHFICDSRESPVFSSVVNMYGEQIVRRIMTLIGGEAVRGNVEPLGDILIAMNKKYCDNLRIWLQQYVNETLCPRTTQQQREAFILMAVKTKQPNKRKLQEHIQEFTLICRGLIGVEVTRSLPSF